MLSFLTGLNPTTILIYLGVSAGIFMGGFYSAWHYKGLEEQAALVAATQHAAEVVTKQESTTEAVAEKAAEVQTVIQDRIVTEIRYVPKYITVKSDAKCAIPVGFIRLHDAAASGMPLVSDAAGKPDGTSASAPDLDADSGVKLSEVGAVVVQNYGEYAQVAAQLTALQDWVRQQGMVK